MSLLSMSEGPTPSTRRWFGMSLGLLFLLLGYAFRASHPAVLATVAACSMLLTAVYYAFPATQLTIIRTWQVATYPIAWIMGHALLLAVFYIVLLPLALVLRARGHDPLALRRRARKTGWIDRRRDKPAGSYFKQY